jgi:hypothetical protein
MNEEQTILVAQTAKNAKLSLFIWCDHCRIVTGIKTKATEHGIDETINPGPDGQLAPIKYRQALRTSWGPLRLKDE